MARFALFVQFQSAPGLMARGNPEPLPLPTVLQQFQSAPGLMARGNVAMPVIAVRSERFQSAPGLMARGNPLIAVVPFGREGFNPPPASWPEETRDPPAARKMGGVLSGLSIFQTTILRPMAG